MEFILRNLSSNRVTLDVKTNSFEESYEYDDDDSADREFSKVDDLYDAYKKMTGRRQSPPRRTPDAPAPAREIRRFDSPAPAPEIRRFDSQTDRFLYCVLVALDPTLDLVPDATPFVDRFKSQLRDKVANSAAPLKKHGYSISDAIASIDGGDPGAVRRYIALLTEKSVMIRDGDSWTLCEYHGKPQCLSIDLDATSSEFSEIADAKRKMQAASIDRFKASIDLEKLNAMLVKDLKEIADSIGCETTKTENGKKRNLLKAELREVVKSKLYA